MQALLVLFRLLLPALVVSLYALTVVDVHEHFTRLNPFSVGLSTALTAVALIGATRASFTAVHKNVFTVIAVGTIATLVLVTARYRLAADGPSPDWESVHEHDTEDLAARAARRFSELSHDARETAARLARSPAVAAAAEGSDAQDYLSAAFDALADAPLPSAHPMGTPGATLLDVLGRPLAWIGENVSLEEAFAPEDGVPSSGIFIIEEGVYTYLVAVEPLLSGRGFVSVEIPLVADRRLQNRYLEDYDAISSWIGRRVATDLVHRGDDATRLRSLLAERGDPFEGGTADAPRLYFSLRAGDDVLGIASIAGEAPVVAQLEARQRYRREAAFLLVITALTALGTLLRGVFRPGSVLAALWGTRLVVLATNLPIGLGLDVDNPAHYGSTHLLELARSPIDFMLTTATLLISALILERALRDWEAPSKLAVLLSLAGPIASMCLLAGTNHVILDTWRNSILALSTISLFPFEASRLVLQLGIVFLFLASGAFSFVLMSIGRPADPSGPFAGSILRVLAVDLAALAAVYVVLGRFGLGEHVQLAIFPFALARFVTLRRRRLEKRWSVSGVYVRISTIGALIVSMVVSFYPAIARFEDRTVRDFVETTVAPIVLQHAGSLPFVANATASGIDRMLDEGQLDGLDRADVAYRVWVATDLVASSLSSSVELVDRDGRIVSHFGLNLPSSAGTAAKSVAPEEWILEEESFDNDPKRPPVLLVRRSFSGPDGARWEIRVRMAADWRNLPFISTANPYLALFRTAGFDAPFRFPYRELSLFVLEPDGTPVFQSGTNWVQPDEDLLPEASRSPGWWTYSADEEQHLAYSFRDDAHIFVLSYVKTGPMTYAAELAAWALFATGLTLAGLVIAVVIGALGSGSGVSPAELWAAIGTSFHGKLYVAFVLIALVPIASLAFLVRGVVSRQLERNVERDGVSQAYVVERFVDDYLRNPRSVSSEPNSPNSPNRPNRPNRPDAPNPPDRPSETRVDAPGEALITDGLLEWIGSVAGVDVDLYARGELVATSKPELFDSGLLRSRASPTAFRDLVLDNRSYSVHRESVGSFEYIVVSVPVAIVAGQGSGILTLPLASQQNEIERRVTFMNQTLLIAAMCISLAAAALAYSLARRIAGPINALTDATHRVAGGDLDVSLQTTSEDEIGALVASFSQMTADLKRQRSDLERTKKLEAWAEMARQVAHEVKNPLTPIQLATEHLLRVHDDPNVDFERVLQDCSDTILQQVKSLRQISMEFSTFASPEPLKPEPTDMQRLVRETLEPYVQSPPDGVSVDVAVADDLPVLQADARLLKRTLLNLVENALHAIHGAGTVSVGVSGTTDNGTRSVVVVVSDSGVGIEPELKERIFEPYFSTRVAGTGLGLAIAKKVVEEHGGTIELESEPGRGTTVRMRLPVRD